MYNIENIGLYVVLGELKFQYLLSLHYLLHVFVGPIEWIL